MYFIPSGNKTLHENIFPTTFVNLKSPQDTIINKWDNSMTENHVSNLFSSIDLYLFRSPQFLLKVLICIKRSKLFQYDSQSGLGLQKVKHES